ncbi:DUF3703 domain-containing protein [Hymenobacter amundsenii]|uniref:DUF3703 domain-containing protein n=1 Tax=Hymenobacter amundsenii TaxID=2006685 RepID=UPI0013FD227F|nr:DUF3703 domain-containing protein [Hymenobacter amundsenii]
MRAPPGRATYTPLNFRLPSRLRLYYHAELPAVRAATSRQNLRASFAHLERAHILGQRQALPHTHPHLLRVNGGGAPL